VLLVDMADCSRASAGRRRWSAVAGQPPPRQGVSGYSSEAMAADAIALMDALGWPRAHLVGMSLGGACP
jgi:pimeloyl-ACP methyl ester carboxylesterase